MMMMMMVALKNVLLFPTLCEADFELSKAQKFLKQEEQSDEDKESEYESDDFSSSDGFESSDLNDESNNDQDQQSDYSEEGEYENYVITSNTNTILLRFSL